jgi:hypothetical protein
MYSLRSDYHFALSDEMMRFFVRRDKSDSRDKGDGASLNRIEAHLLHAFL